MLVMRDTTTVPTAQYSFGLPGTRPEHTIRKPAPVEGEYTLRILPCDSSNNMVNL